MVNHLLKRQKWQQKIAHFFAVIKVTPLKIIKW